MYIGLVNKEFRETAGKASRNGDGDPVLFRLVEWLAIRLGIIRAKGGVK